MPDEKLNKLFAYLPVVIYALKPSKFNRPQQLKRDMPITADEVGPV